MIIDQSKKQHLISLAEISDSDLYHIVRRGVTFSKDMEAIDQKLKGLVVGIYFKKTSTRTRTAFSAAALRMGAQIISFGPHDLQENTGESITDTARVLSCMLDAIVIRTAAPAEDLRSFACQAKMSVINAMCRDEHPTQALADLTTMLEIFGEISGLRVLYVGEGNNTATALALALSRFRNCTIYFATPPGYGLPQGLLTNVEKTALGNQTTILETHSMEHLPQDIDIVYTTRWQTTGTEKKDAHWRDVFAPYCISEAIMDKYPKAIFMHDLPAHRGEEVDASILDGPASVAFRQAANKLHSAKAVLEWAFLGA